MEDREDLVDSRWWGDTTIVPTAGLTNDILMKIHGDMRERMTEQAAVHGWEPVEGNDVFRIKVSRSYRATDPTLGECAVSREEFLKLANREPTEADVSHLWVQYKMAVRKIDD